MGNTRTRCPVCNRFGSDALGGYCKAHKPEEPKGIVKHIKQDMYFGHKFHKGPFISDSYGYKRYGYER